MHHDAAEFIIKILSQVHMEIREPYIQRTSLSFPFHKESEVNLILSTAKADWNNNMMVDRVSPIMENFYFQLKCQYKCGTNNADGSKCDGTDVLYEVHQFLLLFVSASTTMEATTDILELMQATFRPTDIRYTCSKCDKLQNGTVEKQFVRTPKTLVSQLFYMASL